MQRFTLPLFFLMALFAGRCAGQPTSSPTPTLPAETLGPPPTAIAVSPVTPIPQGGRPILPSDLKGWLIFAPGDGSIWLQDLPPNGSRNLVPASREVYAEMPAFSPDGTLVSFKQTAVTAQSSAQVSIQLIGADGSNRHSLVMPPDPKSDVSAPAFSPDGKWVYYTVDSADHRHSEIQRIPVAGGSGQRVLDDARGGVLSPDAKQIAFLHFNIERFTSSLWISAADGSNRRSLLNEDVFLTIAAPHFSPDGQWILFAASGPPRHQLRGLNSQPTHACEPAVLCALVAPAYADGLPWDLWIISVDGTRYRQLTNIGGDSPWPAWFRNGKYVAFFQTNGTFLLDVTTGVITVMSKSAGHGVMDWWSPG